jgi:hypothetical protein
MTETEAFYVPLGDEILMHAPSSLRFTDQICRSAGGPSQTVAGHVWLTHDLLAFRPKLGMPHPQLVTLQRDAIAGIECVQPKLLGLFKTGQPRLQVHYPQVGVSTPHLFEIENPEQFARALAQPRRLQRRSARELVNDALRAEERERGRYTSALEQLSFPRQHWYTEDAAGRDAALRAGLEKLGLDVPSNLLAELDLEVQVETGPEDYEIGPGTEDWGRREQIRRVCLAVNAALGAGERRFYAYAEDLPGWPADFEPLWLWLSKLEDEQLRRLDILRAKSAEPESKPA